ncbi:hypothetical protein SAMN05216371_3837 [Streptomyces sp. TLI_053]|uniref:zinc finger domain-containing protein n=1 Tax=Streptomyces sp. TLI_053 TaxID=1855352 RepID=UPI00087DAE8D|nr:hypothetical protein [Streptomyces sp. TLI_053]SDT69637.1 hypothetical protein SAMN05216371_3837 [Streptomyces sp. TLI_053]
MTPEEVAALLAYAGELDPRTANTDEEEARAQLRRWCELLQDVPAVAVEGWDAAAVVRRHIASSPWPIIAADVARPWAAHRRALLARHTDPRPAVDPDDDRAYRDAIRAQRAAVATGQTVPNSTRQLTGGPAASVAARLGRALPAAAAEQLAAYRPVRAAREAAAAAGRPDALAVACDWCHAPAGEPCRRRTLPPGAQAGTWSRRRTVHPTRTDKAAARRQESAA